MVAKEKANTKQDKDAYVTGKKAEDSPKEVNVLKNETKAHALWTLAAAEENEDAIEMLPILEKNMKKS